MPKNSIYVLFLVLFLTLSSASAARPRIYASPDQRDEIIQKIENLNWASNYFAELKERVDEYVALVNEDPDWLVSRLAMNWDTRYTTTLVKNSRAVGGEGRAPVPTPRFAGARNWETRYSVPGQFGSIGRTPPLKELQPYNDKDGKIRLRNDDTGEFEWVCPSRTGHVIRYINSKVLGLASDAAFLYWITGEEKYAELAAPVVWSYMHGFSHTTTVCQ